MQDDSQPAAPQGVSSLLVVPEATLGLRKGGGQRTALLYEGARHAGPVSVVVLGRQRGAPGSLEAAFPGAEEIVVLDRGGGAPPSAGPLRRLADGVRRHVAVASEYRADPELARALRAIVARRGVEVVLFRLFRTFCVAGLDGPGPRPGLVVDVDDRDDQKARARFAALAGAGVTRALAEPLVLRRLGRFLLDRLARADGAWFVAEPDMPARGDVPAVLMENVPLNRPRPDGPRPASEGRDILFIGSARFAPNNRGLAWFLGNCWPEIARRRPGTRLRIVGAGDWPGVVAAAPCREGVEVVGHAPTLDAEYDRARLVICPIDFGGGSKVKLIEACAFARPVVATPHASRGFGPEIVAGLSVAEDAGAFVRACLAFLDDPDLADRTGAALGAAQARAYTPEAFRDRVAAELARVAAARRRGAPPAPG